MLILLAFDVLFPQIKEKLERAAFLLLDSHVVLPRVQRDYVLRHFN